MRLILIWRVSLATNAHNETFVNFYKLMGVMTSAAPEIGRKLTISSEKSWHRLGRSVEYGKAEKIRVVFFTNQCKVRSKSGEHR
jgi:hypothetical protein